MRQNTHLLVESLSLGRQRILCSMSSIADYCCMVICYGLLMSFSTVAMENHFLRCTASLITLLPRVPISSCNERLQARAEPCATHCYVTGYPAGSLRLYGKSSRLEGCKTTAGESGTLPGFSGSLRKSGSISPIRCGMALASEMDSR
jgi:hypothetical protein